MKINYIEDMNDNSENNKIAITKSKDLEKIGNSIVLTSKLLLEHNSRKYDFKGLLINELNGIVVRRVFQSSRSNFNIVLSLKSNLHWKLKPWTLSEYDPINNILNDKYSFENVDNFVLDDQAKFFAVSFEKITHIFNYQGKLIKEIIGNHDQSLRQIKFSSDSKYFFSLRDTIIMYDTNTWESKILLDGANYFIVTNDNKYIYYKSWGESLIKKWDINNKKLTNTIETHSLASLFKISKNDQYLILKTGKIVLVFNNLTNCLISEIKFSEDIEDFCISSNESFLAIAHMGELTIWDIENKIKVKTFHAQNIPIRFVCFSNDNKYLLTSDLESLKCWH